MESSQKPTVFRGRIKEVMFPSAAPNLQIVFAAHATAISLLSSPLLLGQGQNCSRKSAGGRRGLENESHPFWHPSPRHGPQLLPCLPTIRLLNGIARANSHRGRESRCMTMARWEVGVDVVWHPQWHSTYVGANLGIPASLVHCTTQQMFSPV